MKSQRDQYETKVRSRNNFFFAKKNAPRCGHCRELAPEFARAATLLRGSNTSLAKVTQ